MFNIDMSLPACANDINLRATKKPGLLKKPLAAGSDRSQILRHKNKINQLNQLTTQILINLFKYIFF